MKIICAGLPKTGTKSLVMALRQLGYTVYDSPEHALFHNEEWGRILDGKTTSEAFLEMYDDVDAVADTPACAMWDHILEAYPDAKVILTVRDNEDTWYDSFRRHFKKYGEVYPLSKNSERLEIITRLASSSLNRHWKTINNGLIACFGFQVCSDNTNQMLAKSAYRRHNAYVEGRCRSDQLLVFNVKSGWKPLCEFLGHDLSDRGPFPHVNKNGEIIPDNLGFENLATLKKTLVNQLISGLFMKFVFVCLLVGVFIMI
ncbi:uncharacterized protein LOC120346314 [Styela clava]|uniref:uncharacterized protein LOC120346314 n=1 Tax=Styela clava TaxID=7725 RepID=UPI00193A8351|nr:uncharacterized protein LOC120346314 [Styela clava]